MMPKKLNTEEFIKRANHAHNHKYNYDKVLYINAKNKVSVGCKLHGYFDIVPSAHLNNKQGCPVCGVISSSLNRTPTKEDFIRKALSVHGNMYDYSKVIYKNNKSPVIISCLEHGDFKQTPSNHITGASNCPKCSRINSAEIRTKTIEVFVEEAIAIHGDKYDYSKSLYKGAHIPIKITCKKHKKEFEVIPNNHLINSGCPKCSLLNRTRTTPEFIEQAVQVHGDIYDYSKTVFKKAHSKVVVGCKYHGFFKIIANSHLKGHGCKECGFLRQGFSRTVFKNLCIKNNDGFGVIYLLKCYNEKELFYKIGITSVGLKKRFRGEGSMPYRYDVVREITTDPEKVYNTEKIILREMGKHKYKPKISFGGDTECFSDLEPILNCLEKYLNITKLP